MLLGNNMNTVFHVLSTGHLNTFPCRFYHTKNYSKWGSSIQSGYVPELHGKAAARREPQEKRADNTEEGILCLCKSVALSNYLWFFSCSYFCMLNTDNIWGEYWFILHYLSKVSVDCQVLSPPSKNCKLKNQEIRSFSVCCRAKYFILHQKHI